jgi:hypothetical protein
MRGPSRGTSAQSSASSATTNPRTRTAEWPACSTTQAPRLVEMLTARLNPVPLVDFAHTYRLRQPSLGR